MTLNSKIILASYSYTGNQSVGAALSLLGYRVCNTTQHFEEHFEYWWRIATCQVLDPSIFRKMYANYDVIIGNPSLLFWEYIYKAFPKSQVIIIEKDSVKWLEEVDLKMQRRFFNYELLAYRHLPKVLFTIFAPEMWRQISLEKWAFQQVIGPFNLSMDQSNDFADQISITSKMMRQEARRQLPIVNRMIALKRYTEHNSYVRTRVPEKVLLTYHPDLGWEPLCDFLDKRNPGIEFPQKCPDWFDTHDRRKHIVEQFHFRCKFAIFVLLVILGIILYR